MAFPQDIADERRTESPEIEQLISLYRERRDEEREPTLAVEIERNLAGDVSKAAAIVANDQDVYIALRPSISTRGGAIQHNRVNAVAQRTRDPAGEFFRRNAIAVGVSCALRLLGYHLVTVL